MAVLMCFLLPGSHDDSRGGRRTSAAILIGIAVWLALTTAWTNRYWWDDGTLFEHSLAQDARHLEARMILAGRAFERREYVESVRQLRRVTDGLADAGFVAHADPYRAHANLGTALLHLRLNTEAGEEFEAALQYRPNSSRAHSSVGVAALQCAATTDRQRGSSEREKALRKARRHFARALELAPQDASCRHNLAVSLLELGEPLACVQLLHDYVQIHEEDLSCRLDLASALLVLERYEEAESHFEVLLGKESENPVYRAQLAWCQWKTGKQEQARQNLQGARKKAPTHPIVLRVARMISQD